MKHTLHQKIGSETKERKLIFFASQASDSDSLESPKTNTHRPEFHEKLVESFKPGIQKQVKADVITDEDYRNKIYPVLNDSAKMGEDRYQHFMKALSAGKLRDPMRFWDAINKPKNSKERRRAEEILEDLQKSEVKYSKAKENKLIEELNEIRAIDITEQTNEEARRIAKTGEKDDIKEDRKSTLRKIDLALPPKDIYTIEEPPEHASEEHFKIQGKIIKMMKRINEQHKRFEKFLEDGQPNHAKEPWNQIRKLQKRLEKLEKQRENLEINDYDSRMLAQKDAIDRLSKKLGFNVLDTEKIIYWQLDENVDKIPKGLGVSGIQVDDQGLATKLEGELKIIKIYFEPPEDPNEQDQAGEMRIVYMTDSGEEEDVPIVNFQKFLSPREAYAVDLEAKDRKALKKLFKSRLGYDVNPGDEFTQQYIIENDETGEPQTITETFKIEDLFQKDNGDWIVRLDKPAMSNPKNRFHAMPAELYFDRLKQKMTANEFITFAKRNKISATSKLMDPTARKELLKRGQKNLKLKLEDQTKGMEPEQRDVLAYLNGSEEDEPDKPKLSDDQKKYATALLGKPDKPIIVDPEEGETEETLINYGNGQKGKAKVTRKDGKLIYELDSEDEDGKTITFDTASKILGPDRLKDRYKPERDKKGKYKLKLDSDKKDKPDAKKKKAGDSVTKLKDGWKFKDINPDLHASINNKGQFQDATPEEIAQLQATPPQQPAAPAQPQQAQPDQAPEEVPAEPVDANDRIILPYDKMAKRELSTPEKTGYLRSVWLNTRFLSMGDLWEMGKVIYEFAKRKWERDQKERFADVGKNLPWMKPEMERINQQAEQEQVDQYKAGLENEGSMTIQERLRTTNDRDELKACFIVLSAKGELRWDDVEMWAQLNRWADSSQTPLIPIPSNGDPSTIVDQEGNTGMEYVKPVMDNIWGEGSFDEWFKQNKSNYNSNVQGFFEKGAELESVTGGIDKELQKLLIMHKKGEYVNPHLYESLIHYAIDQGKSDMYVKIYYLVQGVTATNPDGRTLMSFDRIAHMNGSLLLKFPIFDFFTAAVGRKGDPTGEDHKFTIEDYREWARWFDSYDTKGECKPNEAVNDFLWKHAIPFPNSQRRIVKALKDPQLDHEDIPYFLPSADVQSIDDLTKPTAGSRRFFSNEAYANGFPGYSQYIKSLGEDLNESQNPADSPKFDYLLGSLISYVRYESTLQGRYNPKVNTFKLPDTMMEKPAIMSRGVPVRTVANDLNNVIKAAINYYAQYDPSLVGIAEEIYNTSIDQFSNQQDIENNMKAHQTFTKNFKNTVKRVDGGKRLLQIIEAGQLSGIHYQDAQEKALAKKRAAHVEPEP